MYTRGERAQHGKPDSVVGRDDQPGTGDGWTLDMEIATTQENDGLQQGAKIQMLEGLEQQRAELNCP
jgi:hypothetical protein